jgi:predicted alpha/beta hydrolase
MGVQVGRKLVIMLKAVVAVLIAGVTAGVIGTVLRLPDWATFLFGGVVGAVLVFWMIEEKSDDENGR